MAKITLTTEHIKELREAGRTPDRYDKEMYTKPFRVGRKQGKAVLDSLGKEVVFFNDSEKQAEMYCEYLNNSPKKEKVIK